VALWHSDRHKRCKAVHAKLPTLHRVLYLTYSAAIFVVPGETQTNAEHLVHKSRLPRGNNAKLRSDNHSRNTNNRLNKWVPRPPKGKSRTAN